MDLWQLQIFCRVVELKSFSAAGKTVRLSQPTISSHIKDLESHFGCRLIDRLSTEAVPTKAGQLLYRYALKMIALKEETETALTEFLGNMRGHLKVGGSTIPGVYILPKIIGAFKTDYPDVTISLIIGGTDKIISDILSGDLEISIVGARTKNKKISQQKLIEDELRLIVPKDHRWARKKSIQLGDMLQEPFIVREHGSGTLKSIDLNLAHDGKSVEDLNIVAEMGTTEAITQGIKNRVGVSILSTIAVAEDIQSGALSALAIQHLDLKRSFYLTTHRHRSASPLCQAFIGFLKTWTGKGSPCSTNSKGRK